MSAAATEPTIVPPPVPAPSRPSQDFGDWLSPMLVKELRQGMRSRVFVISFLLLQLAMVLLAIVGLTASSFDQASDSVNVFFWLIIAVPLMLVVPVTGLNAIGGESSADTLELIFLTRLTARRIIIGKWVALVAQSLLLMAAVLPYAVLRYFLGGVDLVLELTLLGLLTFISAVLTAVAVGLSPVPTKVARIILVLVFVGVVIVLGGYTLAFVFLGPFRSAFGGSGGGPSWSDSIAWFVAAIGVMAFMLEIGSAKLGPAAENHTTPVRLIGLAMGLASLACLPIVTHQWATVPLIVVAVVLQVLAIFTGLSESPERPFSLYRPFVRLGALGRLAGRVFYPGWPSAVLYTLLIALLWLAGARLSGAWEDDAFSGLVTIVILAAGAMLFPAAIIHTFFPGARLPFVWFLVVYAFGGFVQAMAAAIWDFRRVDFRPFVHLLPSCGLVAAISEVNATNRGALISGSLAGSLIVTVLSVLLLVWSMRKPWAVWRKSEAQVAEWMGGGR